MHKEKLLFANEGVVVRKIGEQVQKTVLAGDAQLTGHWSPEELVDRETRALKLLRGVSDVPQFISRDEPATFTMTFISGEGLSEYPPIAPHSNYFNALEKMLQGIRVRGVFRIGQNRKDYLVRPDGSPAVIDFGNVGFAKDNPILGAVEKVWTALRVRDLKRRFAGKKRADSGRSRE